jgi:hypothetical protein
MKKFRLILLAVAAQQLVAIGSGEPAQAVCPSGSSSVVGVHSVRNAITVGAQVGSPPRQCGGSEVSAAQTVNPIRDSDLDAACVRQAITGGFDPFGFCDLPPNPAAPAQPLAPVLTPGLVARAFRNINLPASQLITSPQRAARWSTSTRTSTPSSRRSTGRCGCWGGR